MNKVKRSGAGIVLLDNKIPPEGGIIAVKELMTNADTRGPVVYFSANTQVEQLSVEAGTKYALTKHAARLVIDRQVIFEPFGYVYNIWYGLF